MFLFKKKYDVVFYYPQHFNRSVNGTNPFFDPLITICEENQLRYLLIEEPDRGTTFPKNKKAYQFDFYFYLILLSRKMISLFFFKHFENREQWIGQILKKVTLGRFSATVIFTISNSMGGFWRGYCPKARIIDYQHGIINKKQPGFFSNEKAPLHIVKNDKEVAVWGKGFYDIFNQDNQYYKNKVHVLGYYQSVEKRITTSSTSNKIVFSLQFLPDFGLQINKEMLDEIDANINKMSLLSPEYRPQVVLKNHPRHNDAVDLNEIINKYDFVSLMPDNETLIPTDYLLNVTFFSTTAFEMAIKGIPSYFLYTENMMNGKLEFLEDYNYPIKQNFGLDELWLQYQKDKKVWMLHSNLVKEWTEHFFEPFNQQVFLELLQKKMN